jgi:Flp pilus assembly protein TadG
MKKGTDMQTPLRLAREEHGAELVEFALAASLLALILFGMLQWMFAMYAYHFTNYAAEQGTRFAMVRGYTWSKDTATNCSTSAPPNFTMTYGCTASSADIQNYVQTLATVGLKSSSVTTNTTNWPGTTPDGASCAQTNSQGCLVKVTVSYSYSFIPFLKISALPISATSEAVIVQ